MLPDVQSTAGLTPDPISLCSHIARLSRELRLARRLLRVTIEARREGDNRQPRQRSAPKEVANVAQA
jgi:hypothetical protein